MIKKGPSQSHEMTMGWPYYNSRELEDYGGVYFYTTAALDFVQHKGAFEPDHSSCIGFNTV